MDKSEHLDWIHGWANVSLQERRLLEQTWERETEDPDWGPEDYDIGYEAELVDELMVYQIAADEDEGFWTKLELWEQFIYDHTLWLAMEQACDEGVLLPLEQRAIRLQSAPAYMRDGLEYMVTHCPPHVLHRLMRLFHFLVRISRIRRLGVADWRPTLPGPATVPVHPDQ